MKQSTWLKSLSGEKKTQEHNPYIISADDYVVEVICESFTLVLGEPHDKEKRQNKHYLIFIIESKLCRFSINAHKKLRI